ncbi:hypothetical protein [Enterococcus pallens]|uniref:Uncharacterized protein n=1 Tax=Enterococcus pallens ATCC BAA-351 TaxID=1158607 RepID=R2QM71_9ENTE|nr:hypothetical protein [Enterococcus pallens]EOH96288.1 hypothetical protein UAU_00938 [Enterococcus pallens ATCC BAA-351]EOU14499.1 hypothetical protein I588_04856 [Enterococcus pallens ATCC BAA-351]
MNKNLSRLYLVFWLVPAIVSPFQWFSSVVQDVEIFRPIDGSGILVARNFGTLTILYFLLLAGMLVSEFFKKNYILQVVIIAFQIMFSTIFSMLPRIIIGPTGLSQSGMSDVDFYLRALLLSIEPGYMIALLSLVISVGWYFAFNICLKNKSI